MANLLATKPLKLIVNEAQETGAHSLRRALGPTNLITLGIGAIIGTGIFVLTGTASANHAGPAIVLSFVLAAIACVFAGLCYAEFASMIPVAGSAYTYGYATLGEFVAWIIGWDLILEYALGAATVASGWSGYVLSLLGDLGIRVSPVLAGAPGTKFVLYHGHWERLAGIAKKLAIEHIDPASLPATTSSFNLFGFLGIAMVTVILVIGIKESANFNSFIVIIKVCVLLVFLALGGAYILSHWSEAVANWHPFLPPNTGNYGAFGISGIATAAGIIFFAYIGFDAVSTAAQEAKNPSRDMPIGILGSLAICTIIYIGVAIVLLGIVPYQRLNVADPLAVGIDATGLRWLSPVIKMAALFGLFSTMLVNLLAQTRIFYSMSRDGLLPPVFARVHPRFRTPHVSTILIGTIISLVAGFTRIEVLGQLVSIGTLLAFVLVSLGIIILRKTMPDAPRPFRTPGVPWVPVVGALICLAQMIGLPMATWERLVIWPAIGP